MLVHHNHTKEKPSNITISHFTFSLRKYPNCIAFLCRLEAISLDVTIPKQ